MKSISLWCKRALCAIPLVVGCSDGHPDPIGSAQQALDDQRADLEALAQVPVVLTEDLCPAGRGGMRCFAKRLTQMNGEPMVAQAAAPPANSLGAKDIQAAYKLPMSGGNHRTVAIVDAFHAPNAEADMGVYRAFYNLPPCTTANGCFKQLNQMGQPGPYPPPDAGWIGEIMVDLDMVSATCPDCNILLIEANTSNGVDLGPCVALAAQMGAVSVNNSYGGPESDPDSVASFNFYTQPGTAVVASSGDDGYLRTPNDQGTVIQEIAFPAASPAVVSVGGTSLRTSTSTRGWAETVWRGAGSGCSKTQPKPTWQKDPICTKRMVADLAAVGDPATGVATYNSGSNGWIAIGGTSVSAPIIAGIFGLFNISDPAWGYAHPASFFDVITGVNTPANVTSCGNYQCAAGAGYDGPTGLGTPNGALFNAPAVDGGSGAGTGGSGGSGGAGAGGSGTTTGGGGAVGTGTAGASGTTTGAGGAGTGVGGSATSGTTTGTGTTTTGASTSSTTGAPSTTTTGSAGAGGSGTVTQIQPDEAKGCSCRVGATPQSSKTDLASLFVLGLGGLAVRRRVRLRRSR